MGQKVTTRVVDKSRQDMAKYKLLVLLIRLLHKIEPNLVELQPKIC